MVVPEEKGARTAELTVEGRGTTGRRYWPRSLPYASFAGQSWAAFITGENTKGQVYINISGEIAVPHQLNQRDQQYSPHARCGARVPSH
jgi:hypothetical protein